MPPFNVIEYEKTEDLEVEFYKKELAYSENRVAFLTKELKTCTLALISVIACLLISIIINII